MDQHGLLHNAGLIMAEHGNDVVLPESIGRLVKCELKNMALQQYRSISMKVRDGMTSIAISSEVLIQLPLGIWILLKGAKVFDEVYVVVLNNSSKTVLFSGRALRFNSRSHKGYP